MSCSIAFSLRNAGPGPTIESDGCKAASAARGSTVSLLAFEGAGRP